MLDDEVEKFLILKIFFLSLQIEYTGYMIAQLDRCYLGVLSCDQFVNLIFLLMILSRGDIWKLESMKRTEIRVPKHLMVRKDILQNTEKVTEYIQFIMQQCWNKSLRNYS